MDWRGCCARRATCCMDWGGPAGGKWWRWKGMSKCGGRPTFLLMHGRAWRCTTRRLWESAEWVWRAAGRTSDDGPLLPLFVAPRNRARVEDVTTQASEGSLKMGGWSVRGLRPRAIMILE